MCSFADSINFGELSWHYPSAQNILIGNFEFRKFPATLDERWTRLIKPDCIVPALSYRQTIQSVRFWQVKDTEHANWTSQSHSTGLLHSLNALTLRSRQWVADTRCLPRLNKLPTAAWTPRNLWACFIDLNLRIPLSHPGRLVRLLCPIILILFGTVDRFRNQFPMGDSGSLRG